MDSVKIRIKNFGPIKEGFSENGGWMEIRKVTTFIGNQGSGKSTVAKLISVFSWIEKVLTRGDYTVGWIISSYKFRTKLCAYHKLENYFQDNTELGYIGHSYTMKFTNGQLNIGEVFGGDQRANYLIKYALPQIMYVPAERNFISTINNFKLLKLSSDALVEFLTEFNQAKKSLKKGVQFPLNNTSLEYDTSNDILNIKGENYKIKLTESSSGFQSAVPLFMVSSYLANAVKQQDEKTMTSDEIERYRKRVSEIWSNDDLTDEQRQIALSVVSSVFNKKAFINIVEEPEQNLFPDSQRKILNSLLEFNNLSSQNKLILTTHSPYVINYLSIAIQGKYLENKIKELAHSNGSLKKLYQIVPSESGVSDTDVIIYQMNENNGTINKLNEYDGIPSDNNYLNEFLAEGNSLFDSLLEIEQSL